MNLLRIIAPWFGYDVLRQSKNILLDRHLKNLLKQHKINKVLDVGANIGQYGEMLREFGYTGEIHSFEPVRTTYEKLCESADGDANWYTYNCALGQTKGNMDINVTKASYFSSFHKPNKFGKSLFTDESIIDHIESVPVDTLDNIIDSMPGESSNNRIHLKMDTQGFDIEVFSGLVKHKHDIVTLQSEVSVQDIYAGMPHYLDAMRIYADSGFIITGMFPISRNKENLTLIEFDCTMYNSRHKS